MTVITPDLAARIKIQLGKDIELSIKRANESIADAEKAKGKLALLDSPAYLTALGKLDALDLSAYEYDHESDIVGEDLTPRQRKRIINDLNRVVAKIDLKL